MIRHIIIAFIALGIVGGTCVVLAQGAPPLPSAGLTPSNFFYFFDRLGEKIQEFFTFSPKAKALLQLEFAAERMAEIKLELEVNGPDTKGVNAAREGLAENIEKGNVILKEASDKGVDTRDAEDEFDSELQTLLQTASDEDSDGLNEEIDKMEQELSDDFTVEQEKGTSTRPEKADGVDGVEKPSQSVKSDEDEKQ
ncbi:MAG: DUF5667 domain-containing protein [bacterium]|nr:DUF5667 domain-containing protein [bacterium]